jgi:hypothetical protein
MLVVNPTCSRYNVQINHIKICLKRDDSSGHTIDDIAGIVIHFSGTSMYSAIQEVTHTR